MERCMRINMAASSLKQECLVNVHLCTHHWSDDVMVVYIYIPTVQVLIPVFALGRAQELCILLESFW